MFYISILLCLIPYAIGYYYYDKLPETMATHFNFQSVADGFSSKDSALLTLPTVFIALLIFIHLIIKFAKKVENQDIKAVNFVYILIPFMSKIFHSMMIMYNLGYKVNFNAAMPIILGVIFICLGFIMPKTNQNKLVGVRIPSTLRSKKNWELTHKFTGKLMLITGLVSVVSGILLPNISLFVILLSGVTIVVIPTIYSQKIQKQEKTHD